MTRSEASINWIEREIQRIQYNQRVFNQKEITLHEGKPNKHIITILFVVSISISLFQCPCHLTKRLEYLPSSLPSQSSLLLFYTIPIHFLHSISHPSDLEFASIVSLLPLLPLHNNYGINYESLLLTTHHSLSLLILLHTQCIMDSCF